MGAVGSFIVDKLVKYGIEILVKLILKWVADQERQRQENPQKPTDVKPPDSGWNDKHKENRLFNPDRMMK